MSCDSMSGSLPDFDSGFAHPHTTTRISLNTYGISTGARVRIMVLYHADGTVVVAQEEHLEKEAKSYATKQRFMDPIKQAEQIIEGRRLAAQQDVATEEEHGGRVFIRLEAQNYNELYYCERSSLLGEHLTCRQEKDSDRFPKEGIDRRTFMKCSSTAYDFFTLKPEESILDLPVCYPRVHSLGWLDFWTTYTAFEAYYTEPKVDRLAQPGLAYLKQADDQMAFIRDDEIRTYLIPWLKEMEDSVKRQDERLKDKASEKEGSQPERLVEEPYPYLTIPIPESLIEKIHLYNVTLQLGISTYFKQPLTDALIFQMYRTDLRQCHLDTLEMTVGRFYSRGVPVLDPVLNHLIGTYAFRSVEDRTTNPDEKDRVLESLPEDDDDRDPDIGIYLQGKPTREWLKYTEADPRRKAPFASDTVSHPPKLEVIGNCIRHWSGVRRHGSTAAAHTGYPLNVGRVKKYYRRRATSPIRDKETRPDHIDVADYSTYRLHNLADSNNADDRANFEHFRTYRPGNTATAVPWATAAPTVSTAPTAPTTTAPATTAAATATADNTGASVEGPEE